MLNHKNVCSAPIQDWPNTAPIERPVANIRLSHLQLKWNLDDTSLA